jgi:hypothetical protein
MWRVRKYGAEGKKEARAKAGLCRGTSLGFLQAIYSQNAILKQKELKSCAFSYFR